ncbi:MAG: DUF2155 domain-containing protein [Pseudolabrys sp.]|nr:DUF2155 domain-containing protein [Pseudolabrys sp.]
MAQSRLLICTLACGAALTATSALAQFGGIFSDSPPRPPADVPGQQQGQQPGNFPGRAAPRPQFDEPPARPLPAPMSLPPSSRPGGGAIQSQELPPPPGVRQAPAVPLEQAQPPGAPAQIAPGIRQPPGTAQPADTAPQPGDEVVVAPPPQRIANPTAVFSGLDKITGRIISFDVAINETVQFGALQVTPRVCYSRPPTETPNTDGFIEVDEVTLQGEIKRIFSGWMFAASPGLNAVEHPIYDVWVTDCKGGQSPAVAEAPADAKPAARAPTPTPQRRPAPQPRAQQQFQPPPPGFFPTR